MDPNQRPLWLDTMAHHLRKCALLTNDLLLLGILRTCASDLERQAQELRSQTEEHTQEVPKKNPLQ